jgi:ketosteroid isomerase-like protein
MATSTTSTLDPKVVASRCLEAWSQGDFDAARALLDEHVQFTGPLGHTESADEYIEGVRGLAKSVTSIEQRRIFGEGDDVCIVYDLVTKTSAGAVPTAGWYRVRHGRIVSINAFFDARALISMPPDGGSRANGK